MIKYVTILNEETGLVSIGEGSNTDYYKSIGMIEEDVELSEIDNNWYLSEKCPHYTPEEEAAQREADFKSKFFEIPGYGWFRKVPKGYQSAVESLNLAYNNVAILGKLPAEALIFYQEPDFTKPEECTEEWLIEHQTKSEEMTAADFATFYAGFSTAWNNTEHN